eukprot:183322-Chlamydomonas_euryale.AAC.2
MAAIMRIACRCMLAPLTQLHPPFLPLNVPHRRVWSCPLCMNRNHFPPHYQGISEQSMPAELYATYCTIEYTLNRTVQPHPPVYLFMIDTCVSEEELAACKAAVTQVWWRDGMRCLCGGFLVCGK